MHCRSDYKAAELSTFVSQVSCHISGYYLIHVWLSFSPDWSKPSQTALGVSLPPCLLSHSCLISTAVTLPGETSPEFPVWQIHCRRSRPATTWSPQHHMAGINSKRTSGYSSFPVFPVPEMGPKPPCSHGY